MHLATLEKFVPRGVQSLFHLAESQKGRRFYAAFQRLIVFEANTHLFRRLFLSEFFLHANFD